jgi:hypothetical protein
VAAALGVAATMGLVTATVVAEQALVGGAAASKPLTLLSVLKWLGVGMTAGALVGGGAHVAFRPARVGTLAPTDSVSPAAAPAELRQVAPAVVPPPPPAAAEEDEEEALEETAAPPPARSGPPAPRVATTPAPAVTGAPLGSTASFDTTASSVSPATIATPSLTEEVAALDAARRERAAGRTRSAVTAIDSYRSRFPAGSLRTEATVLRVEALLGSGDRAGAEREANAIVRAAPGSRHAARVLELLER